MDIQIADPNDPRFPARRARDAARQRLSAMQSLCGCYDGATCVVCAPLASEAVRLATAYADLYVPIILTSTDRLPLCLDLPIGQWAWQGDAADTESREG